MDKYTEDCVLRSQYTMQEYNLSVIFLFTNSIVFLS